MIICRSRKFIFIHIHKTGGTSVEQGLDPLLAWDDVILGSTKLGEKINDEYRSRFRLDKHSGVADIERVCGVQLLETSYVFATVRHPLHRICSLYNFVAGIVLRWAELHSVTLEQLRANLQRFVKINQALGWPASRAFIQSRTFSEFIRHPDVRRDGAFLPQVSRLTSSAGVRIAEALPIEKMVEWMPQLRGRLNYDLTLPHSNASDRHLVAPQDVDAVDRGIIEGEFHEDYEAFGYGS